MARRSRLAAALIAILAGGSVFSTCDARLKDAVVGGTRLYISSLLDPNVILEAFGVSMGTDGSDLKTNE